MITWGRPDYGGDSSSVSTELDGTIDVVSIAGTDKAFAAIRSDGSIVTWGESDKGGAISEEYNGFSDGSFLIASEENFCSKDLVGNIFCWGNPNYSFDPQLTGRQF